MEEIKTKEELLEDLKNVANKMFNIKATIEKMLEDFDDLEKKYISISDEITKN